MYGIGLLTIFAAWLLQAAGDIALPGWLLMVMPGVNMLLTQLVLWTNAEDKLDATEKRNINRAVSIALFTVLMLTGQVDVPASAPEVPLIGEWAPFALAYLGYIWQGSQVVHDLLDFFK